MYFSEMVNRSFINFQIKQIYKINLEVMIAFLSISMYIRAKLNIALFLDSGS